MPRLTPFQEPYGKVSRLLVGYGMNALKLSQILGCAWQTADKRLRHPETFTLMELGEVSKKVHIPFDEIREAIQK